MHDLVMGEAQDPVAEPCHDRTPFAVGLERLRVAVVLAAVDLEHEPPVDEEVRFEPTADDRLRLDPRDDPSLREVRLISSPESAARARRLSLSVLGSWGLPQCGETVELLVSELVGNAVNPAPP